MAPSSPDIAIELLPSEAAADADMVADLCGRINRVYSVAEDGLWLEGADRVSEADVSAAVRAEEIAVARLGGRLVGSVRIVQLDRDTGEFGLLVADPEHRGVGIGRELVHFAEKLVKDRGLSQMELELLVPRTWEHPVKTFLHDWYSRLGYREVRRRDFADVRPDRVPLLVTPCDLLTYRKSL